MHVNEENSLNFVTLQKNEKRKKEREEKTRYKNIYVV